MAFCGERVSKKPNRQTHEQATPTPFPHFWALYPPSDDQAYVRNQTKENKLPNRISYSGGKSKLTHHSGDDDNDEVSGFGSFSRVQSEGSDRSGSSSSSREDEEKPTMYLLGTRHDMVEKYLPTEFWQAFREVDVLIREIGMADGADWGPNVQQFVDAGLTSSDRASSEEDETTLVVKDKKPWEGWAHELFQFEQDFLDKYMCCLPDGLDWRHVHPVIVMTRIQHFQRMHAQSPYMDC